MNRIRIRRFVILGAIALIVASMIITLISAAGI